MATVVITFFLLTRFYVCKMDADCIDRRRDRILSRREKRWSMNSQRLEEIVAELMKPISDVRRSFDTDLSALLEEYLTEAGLHALEAGSEGSGSEAGSEAAGPAAPNFAELALLLQHSASVYGRKVDFLYQHVLTVSDSLQQSTHELERSGVEAEVETPGGGRRKRRASAAGGGGGGFEALSPAACGASVREAGARPPPTLPRVYLELEPRQLAAADTPLTDYDREPIGLLADFHVAWRLQDGMLVDELEGWNGSAAGGLRPIPLMELQAALAAAAPPLPPLPPLPPPLSRDASPLPRGASTPLPSPLPPPPSPPPPADLPVKKERKRKHDVSTDDLVGGCYKIILNKELRRKFRKLQEFSLDGAWIGGVVRARRQRVRELRRRLRDQDPLFRGFDECNLDIGGFAGWSSTEAATAAESTTGLASAAAAAAAAAAASEGDSDDDGFFEQSSLGDSDASRVDDSLATPNTALDNSAWTSWQAGVVARATEGEARGLDVRELAQRLVAALPPAGAAPCRQLLGAAARHPRDAPGLFLATLFLANAGNVELVPGPPLSLDSFSVRLLTPDARLYCAAAGAEPRFRR